ncbi:hypothetical protein ACFW5V_32135 [Streptomyces sp. NPDC058762]|uniref:hypothetical protein n=1 Tax=Streptomyces sp. NPDC058762 TaxID=3346629 RepID=UPI0036983646
MSSFHLDEQETSRRFAAYFKDLEDRIATLERANPLTHASLEGGSIDVYDVDGSLQTVIGEQADGTTGVVHVNGPPPPTPTAPLLAPVINGVAATWDGLFADADTAPLDFSRVEVHADATADFEPSPLTLVSTIESPRGGVFAIPTDTPLYVRFLARNLSGTGSEPSTTAGPESPAKVVADDVVDGIITETKLAKDAVTEAKIALGAVGAAALADGAVLEEKLAKAAVTLGKIADGAVHMNALGGSLVDGVTQRWVDAMGDPQQWTVLASGAGAAWEHLDDVADAPTGHTVARATGYTVVRGTVQVPYDPDALYRVSVRARTTTASTAGADRLYAGLLGVAADGVTLVSRGGVNTSTSAHYIAASNAPLPAADGWTTYVGYVRGRAASGASGTGGEAKDARSPGVMHALVRFVSPVLYLNFASGSTGANSGSGVMEVDAFTIEVLKTGVVDSTNLVAGSVTTAALATDSVAAGKVAADAIGTRELQANSVTALEIAAAAVITEKLAAGAITAEKLAALSVTAEKIAALSITAEKIAALAVTAEKLAALSVTADKLAANAVTATKILAGSIDATHIKAGSLTADRLSIGVDGNVIADPSFEGAISDQRVAADANLSFVAGNGTPRAIQVDCTSATATNRFLSLAQIAVVPGTKLFLGIDYLASTTWAGDKLSLYVRWENESGSTLGYGNVVVAAAEAVRGTWARLQAVASTEAPAGAVRGNIRVSCDGSTAGTVAFDNATARLVLASGFAGARAEVSPLGLQLYNDDGEEAVALMTGRPNYLSLRTDGVSVATIDQEGGAGFQRLAVAETLSIAGTDLSEYLASLPRGILAVDYQVSTRTSSGSEMGFVELACDIDPTRMYRFRFVARANPSTAGGELQIRLRDGGVISPTINSKQLMLAVHQMPLETSFTADLEHIQNGASLGAGNHRFLISFSNLYGPSGQTCTMSGEDGALGYFYIEDAGPHVVETGGYNDGGGTTAPTPQKYTKYYNASWSGTYSRRSSYNSYYGNTCMQGYYSSTNGVMASLIGFPSSLGSDLSGATIIKAEVYLYFDHWYANAGGKAVIKAHSHSSRPSSFSSDAEAKTVNWARNEGKWVDITSVFDSSKWRGIALDPNSTSSTYYGRARGYGQTNPPRLKVTYTK